MKLNILFVITLAAFILAGSGCGGDKKATTASDAGPTGPAAPASLTGIAGNRRVTLNWTPVTDATSYNIYQGASNGVTKASGARIASSPTTSHAYTVTGLTNNTPYYFVVTAVGTDGESVESPQAAIAPRLLPAAPAGVSLAAGDAHTVEIKSDGTLWAWGSNADGQLGDGTTTAKNSPVQTGSDKWVSVAAGSFHTVAIKSDGTLWAWGANADGQLGDGTGIIRTSPVQISTDNIWVSVVAGSSHTVALKSDGTLWAWGWNGYGQLGDGTEMDKFSPVQIGADGKWEHIAAGYAHTVAIKSDGTLWAWGYNYAAQLGDGTTMNKSSPEQIGTDNTWVSVAAGTYHTVAVKADGTLWAWGYNGYGELGDGGTTNHSSSPEKIGTDSTWASVAAGSDHTLALKSDGTLWAWGDNRDGQLGSDDGTTTQRTSPKQLGTDSTWASVAAGGSHTAAVKSDGTLLSWGDNGWGQVGDATTTDRHSPVQIFYIVTPSAGANGNMRPDGAQTIPVNQTISFTVTPDTGYKIGSVTGCGGTLKQGVYTYTTGRITSNCTVTAVFTGL